MIEYKSEILKVSYKLVKASLTEVEVKKLDELINKRSVEGWELVTHSFMGGSDSMASGILVTFKREKG